MIEAIWSPEPPVIAGWYWIRFTSGNIQIRYIGKAWTWGQCDFGPRVPGPVECAELLEAAR